MNAGHQSPSASSINPDHSQVTIIIPLGPGERDYVPLLNELRTLGGCEVLFVCVKGELNHHQSIISSILGDRYRLIEAPKGRANQLNAGVMAASNPLLWFVHADSVGVARQFPGLLARMRRRPHSVWFSNLRFHEPRPEGIRNNEIGVWWRSHFLRMPFGDQALGCSRYVFDLLGGFDPSAPYGEDHLFVWMAHRRDVPLRFSGGTIETSARKYMDDRKAMTRKHRGMAFAQAWPQFVMWLRCQ